METGSVIYACLGSLCRLVPSQLIELGLGLEASNRPFIWVVKTGDRDSELEEWFIGVRIGVEIPVRWGEEDKVGVLVKKDEVRKAVLTLMGGGGEESKSMRSRAIELGKQASKAMESGGSSNRNLSCLIKDIMKQQTQNQKG
ncbi:PHOSPHATIDYLCHOLINE:DIACYLGLYCEROL CHOLINEPHOSPHOTRANSFERASE 1-RELATED [Salix koriyanagi]|uniref:PHOSPHATIDYLCHOLINE:DIACYLGLYCEROL CHOLINEPHOSPHOTRANSFERASE 1-RELATED n=1 Tax=Salix koriyanagi TaxID=2511006 RepID=A0A9Q0ZU02_9ROSI|nr:PHOSPHATIDYLCHOLINE:DIACYLGLYCEROL CHOLINEPHOSPHOTRANSFERASE 1-RELATED [Salix koriyanagi]